MVNYPQLAEAELFLGSVPNEELRKQYIESGWLVSIPLSIIPAHWLSKGEKRLDGGYYSQEAMAAQRVIDDSGFRSKKIRELVSDSFILGRFKRIYATNKKSGWPYLSASEALDFRPISDRWIARDYAPKGAERHFAKQGWLLISSSGTVGRLVIVTKRLEKFFLTHDLIRILPSEKLPIGYLYAFLSTWIGQALIIKDQYGSSIKHLEPHHVKGLPVPLIADDEQEAIHNAIMKAFALRDEANDLLDEADDLLYKELKLPIFNEGDVSYLSASKNSGGISPPLLPHPKAFSIKSSELEARFDSSYHVPTARMAIENLRMGKYRPITLDSMMENILLPNRFKRVYVQQEYGVPFLQGSHLSMMRPYDLKYISKRANEKNIEACLIHEGYVLLTRSGTIGKVSLVSSRLDGWGASEHLLRFITDTSKAYPGYVAAFLMTPYGQYQVLAKIYGGVVDEITADDVGQILIPDAPMPVQKKINELVVNSFEKKDEASEIEGNVIKYLEAILMVKFVNGRELRLSEYRAPSKPAEVFVQPKGE